MSAIAFAEVAKGSHTVSLRASVSSDNVDISDPGMFTICVPFDGDGNLITPTL